MKEFKRGIYNSDFINALNSDFHFQNMVNDKDLFIAIRNEYINVYYYGQSICKITFNRRSKILKYSSHNKYLGINKPNYSDTGIYLDRLVELKENARKYGGKEKEQVKKHILEDNNLCILDVEVTFSPEDDFGYIFRSIPTHFRIDFFQFQTES